MLHIAGALAEAESCLSFNGKRFCPPCAMRIPVLLSNSTVPVATLPPVQRRGTQAHCALSMRSRLYPLYSHARSLRLTSERPIALLMWWFVLISHDAYSSRDWPGEYRTYSLCCIAWWYCNGLWQWSFSPFVPQMVWSFSLWCNLLVMILNSNIDMHDKFIVHNVHKEVDAKKSLWYRK